MWNNDNGSCSGNNSGVGGVSTGSYGCCCNHCCCCNSSANNNNCCC